MESQGIVEFQYANGVVVTRDHARCASRQLTKGDEFEYDGSRWLMYDREDRAGVTVHLCSPSGSVAAPEASPARRRRF